MGCYGLSKRLFESLVDFGPVDNVPESFDKFGPVILIVNVICVFKNVQNQQDPKHGIHVGVVFLYLHYYQSVCLSAQG